MQAFRDLKVWQKAHQLTLDVYKATAMFPREEIFGLTSQIRRSAESIPANISEGCGREGAAEMARYLSMAMGSASELEYHLLLAYDLKFLSNADYQRLDAQVTEVKRMLASFIKTVKSSVKSTVRRTQLKTEN